MRRIPGSTYRLQLHKGFTFDDAAAIAEYVHELGISHVYSSPYLQAAPESMHGYDVVDHRKVNEELGGAAGHERFCKRLGEVGLGQILDIVPNHMSLGEQNRYWWDVLENGTNSRYAAYFDIDWNSSEERLRDKVLVPILGDQYGRVLKEGGIVIARKGSAFTVEVGGQALPVAPQSLAGLLSRAAEIANNDTLSFLADSYGRLPSPDYSDRRTLLARHRDQAVLQGLLSQLCSEENRVCEAIDTAVAAVQADVDALDEFLAQQNYRLAHWKSADQQLGYRRFFDVNTLIGIHVEREYVFEETHALVLRWLEQGVLDGVRVDHPDGLRDPRQYFERLRERAPKAWIVGEKILEPGEWLRKEWPIEGTSGYDFLNLVLGLLVKPEGLKRLGEHYANFTGDETTFPAVAHGKKIDVMQEALGSDVNRLTTIFVAICEEHREYRDFTRADIRRMIREVAACFGVYRTYVVPDRKEVTDDDRKTIERAVECAKGNRGDIDATLFDFMRDVLTNEVAGKQEAEFVYRFQQFTSPVMAKGVEDTAFYCWNRLTAMNEVGADPASEGIGVEAFHAYNERVQQTFPGTMVTLSTHDTKRSDDVRARLAVLTEVPDAFVQFAEELQKLGSQWRGEHVDTGTEWFLYQTMLGAWPISADRLKAYMQKAMREAKMHTSWVANNAAYEDDMNAYIDASLGEATFHDAMEKFVARIDEAGQRNSLTQTLLKYTVPGVPDLYQGSEMWDFSLVDPDNRRPVDYKQRHNALQRIKSMTAAQVMTETAEGLPKLWLIWKALAVRKEQPGSFGADASYTAVAAKGTQAERVIAFRRGESMIAVGQRWPQIDEDHGATLWEDTAIRLPEGTWIDRMTDRTFAGGDLTLAALLTEFPVALLVRLSN